MKFGIRFIQYVGSVREIVELTKLAEDEGFDFAWYPHDTFMTNTWVVASAAAAATQKIRIGSVSTNPYTTLPDELATYVATLDELSGGRAVVGLGMHTADMLGWMGIDAADAVERTREVTAMMRALWRGEVVAAPSPRYPWSDQCYLRFVPLRAEIPIYISRFGRDYVELSGEIGDGSLPMIAPPEAASYMVPMVHAGARRAGRDPAQVDVAGCAWLSIADSGHAAGAVMRRMVAYFAPYLEAPALAAAGFTPEDFGPMRARIEAGDYDGADALVSDEMLRMGIAGTPPEVIRRIETLADIGVTQVNLGSPLGPDPAAAIRLMGRHVMPHFRA